ncbi:SIR2 family protein [Flavobacterium humidisoli]|uniref:SIR2 family protein n=1 Tax=Flavobacterium humidisoli TaxID=2937442 RepID=A0ABY4LKP2_9FLAO|nr:SIR2 family protein [Flavobacterium humidisoli]UPZ13654.1 SIR2 family protein [Flavobacterium humidisoli]
MDIPHHLIEQIKLGNTVLFLGAGASFGTKNQKNDTMPLASELSVLLSKKFLGDITGDLAYTSMLSISESSLYDVQLYVAQTISEFKPLPHHLKIPEFKWKAIFTTNYDSIIESSYQQCKKPLQVLKPISKNTPRTQVFTSDDILPYYKLHGCINDIADNQAPLILTLDQFANYESKRENLFRELQELMINYTFIFVGFAMQDSDIRSILNKLDENHSSRVRSYIVRPNVNEPEERFWEGKKISCLKMTFAEFIEKINNAIDIKTRILSEIRVANDLPIYDKFVSSIQDLSPTEHFLEFIEHKIDYVHLSISAPNMDPKEFYKGNFTNWDPILKNLDIQRDIKDGLLFEIFSKNDVDDEDQYLYLIKGNAGSGKSVLLKRLAYDGATILEKFCIFLKSDTLSFQDIYELNKYVNERIYLFIDNIAALEDDVIYILKKAKKEKIKLTIIGSERLNVWNTECNDLSTYLSQSYQIQYLSDKEINDLVNLLDRHQALYNLKNSSHEERIQAFSKKAGRELLVALYEATNGKPFEEIIFDEYNSINNIKAQSLYLTISIFHKIGTYARAGFISRVHNIPFEEFKNELFKPLEHIVFDKRDYTINDYVYLTRNRMIAEIIFEKVLLSPQDRFDEYVRIINNLNIDYQSDRKAFLEVVNARKLIEIFPDPQMIRRLYVLAETVSKDDPKLFQQQAIFEMVSSGGSMISAEKHLKEANDLSEDDPLILHTYAELLLRKAENTALAPEFFSHIGKVIDICNRIIKAKPTNSHPYHTILKANILKLKKILDINDVPAIERALKDTEKAFSIAKQFLSNDPFILEIESSFNEILEKNTAAKQLLEKAFNANKSSPYIALRLSNFYDKEGENSQAVEVVKQALELNPSEKDLNFRYAMLLDKSDNPSYSDISYYLKRSFTKGDSRFQAQLYYARSLFLLNNMDYKDCFLSLAKANVSPEIKNYISGVIYKNGQKEKFFGAINSEELSYGYIKRDLISDTIYFYKFQQNYKLGNLKRGTRVSFYIGFNYKGPIAFDLKII